MAWKFAEIQREFFSANSLSRFPQTPQGFVKCTNVAKNVQKSNFWPDYILSTKYDDCCLELRPPMPQNLARSFLALAAAYTTETQNLFLAENWKIIIQCGINMTSKLSNPASWRLKQAGKKVKLLFDFDKIAYHGILIEGTRGYTLKTCE